MDRIDEEERKIVRFVRTPEGKGVGVIREEGGEAWVVRGRGTRLGRAGRWDKGDHVVVLDGGKNRFTPTIEKITQLFYQVKASQPTHQQTNP
jgi:hypothetical protein